MIRNAIIYFTGRLPMVADLRQLPGPADLNVVVTNLRTRDGKRPSFADSSESWFVLPLRDVTAIELPRDAMDTTEQPPAEHSAAIALGPAASNAAAPESTTATSAPLPDASPLEPDEDLLARIRQL